MGGDEFAIIQTGGELKLAQTSALAERLIENISAPYSIEGYHVTIGTSLGISLAPEDGTDPDQILQNADLALYRSKSDGRGGYGCFKPRKSIVVRWPDERLSSIYVPVLVAASLRFTISRCWTSKAVKSFRLRHCCGGSIRSAD